ncbi:hypothetical protein RWV98_05735 [Agathobaculum sp. NTUH-O15-33]|uniref:hypothetical protein n=1 Tax=Agathobaculum sp. NTUH-O15-33 TaxID=3079302 RepID=UPI00295884B2|nr:hypothetical protein [Agathobaculum sp. NTUH-O15-33]WNX85768.1 hypothetical protein RWV98_05735 [Agathobaculum sp. NTUH-O15-33]
MGSHVFFNGMALGETNQIMIEDGKTLVVKYLGLGDQNEDGMRSVLFELNGMRRVGCIGCPMAGRKGMRFEFARYPTYERAYIRAFDAMLAERQHRGRLDATWRIGHTGRDIMHWWMADGVLPGQMEMEEVV